MAYYSDSDILVISNPGKVLLFLQSGYGQPVKTTIYMRRLDGSTHQLDESEGNIDRYTLGESSQLKGQVIEVHSTIHDIRDNISGQEVEDIKLTIKVSCNDDSVNTEFLKRTKGKGKLLTCRYEVNLF